MTFFPVGSAATMGRHPNVRLLSIAYDVRLTHCLHVGRGE